MIYFAGIINIRLVSKF